MSLAALAVVGGLARGAHAQCAGGRVVTEDTAGRCCWPGQRWNDEAGRCEGVPQCPPGMGGAGATCEALSAPAPAPVPPVATAVATAVAAPPPSVAGFAAAAPSWGEPQRSLDTAPTWGMVATGTSLFLTGWLPMVVLGSIQLTGYGSCTGWAAANFVPLLGAAIAALGADVCLSFYDNWWFSYAVGYVASGVQLLGFILFIAGLLSRRAPRRGYATEWELAPGVTLRPSSAPGAIELRF